MDFIDFVNVHADVPNIQVGGFVWGYLDFIFNNWKDNKEMKTKEEDSWIAVSDKLDLNIHIKNDCIYLDVYPVIEGKTITKTWVTISIISISELEKDIKEGYYENICPVCHGTIYPWDSGCQNCQ